jgi:flagellin
MTNTSAMVALQTLRTINMNLDQTNNRVSTGFRVGSASDNAAYWSIATTLRSDNSALSAVQDSLGVGKSAVDTVSTGLDTARTALQQIKDKLVSASQPGIDRAKLQTEIAALLSQIRGAAQSTVTGGVNWLSVDSSEPGYAANKSFVSSYARTGDAVTVTSIQIDSSSIKLYDGNVDLHTLIDDAVVTELTTYSAAAATAYDTLVTAQTTANDAYDTAIEAADDAFDVDGDAGARDVAYATALAAKNLAFSDAQTVFDDAIEALEDTLVTNLDDASVDANGDPLFLGLIDKARVAVSSVNGAAYVGSVAEIDIGALSDSDYDLAKIGNMMQIVDDALLDMTDASTVLGAAGARLTSQMTFVKALFDANASAVGSLVDANMEEESTKLRALQTQQQLAVQSLSIANASTQNILLLFRQ